MSNVLNLSTGAAPDTKAALEVIDEMRRAIAAGELVAFVAAGITAGDVSLGYSGGIGGVTRLRMMGAIANLQHSYHSGALSEDE